LGFGDFKKECSTVSFMSSKRMVVLKNVISKSKNKNLQKEIVEFLKNSNSMEDNMLIFFEEAVNAKSFLHKFLMSANNNIKMYKQEFKLLDKYELKKWIFKEVAEKNGEIENGADLILMERVGSDLWQINNELDKLINFEKKITGNNIKKMVKARDDENIFNLTDAIGAKNKKMALKFLTEQLRSGFSVNYILTMMSRQFRLLIEAKDYLAKSGLNNVSPQNLARDLRVHPFVARKLLEQEGLYQMKELREMYNRIMEIDLKSKTAAIDIELLLDLFIVGKKIGRMDN